MKKPKAARVLMVLLTAVLFGMLPGCRLAQTVLPFFLLDQAPPKVERSQRQGDLAGDGMIVPDPEVVAAAGGSR